MLSISLTVVIDNCCQLTGFVFAVKIKDFAFFRAFQPAWLNDYRFAKAVMLGHGCLGNGSIRHGDGHENYF